MSGADGEQVLDGGVRGDAGMVSPFEELNSGVVGGGKRWRLLGS